MPGGGDVFVETENFILNSSSIEYFDLQPGNYVKISVTDTGEGMDKATMDKIFEPFFTTDETKIGTGLGLASVYGIIKHHGGTIDVYSEKGSGTSFKIYLPASDKAVIGEKTPSQEVLPGTETILLIDDEDMILDVGREMLEGLGYRVIVAKSGREAVTLYEENAADIQAVILDMIMPGMNGKETFTALQKANPNIKVLLSSGYSIDGDAEKILAMGCQGFIQKPFNLSRLSQKVRDVLAA